MAKILAVSLLFGALAAQGRAGAGKAGAEGGLQKAVDDVLKASRELDGTLTLRLSAGSDEIIPLNPDSVNFDPRNFTQPFRVWSKNNFILNYFVGYQFKPLKSMQLTLDANFQPDYAAFRPLDGTASWLNLHVGTRIDFGDDFDLRIDFVNRSTQQHIGLLDNSFLFPVDILEDPNNLNSWVRGTYVNVQNRLTVAFQNAKTLNFEPKFSFTWLNETRDYPAARIYGIDGDELKPSYLVNNNVIQFAGTGTVTAGLSIRPIDTFQFGASTTVTAEVLSIGTQTTPFRVGNRRIDTFMSFSPSRFFNLRTSYTLSANEYRFNPDSTLTTSYLGVSQLNQAENVMAGWVFNERLVVNHTISVQVQLR